MSPHDHNERVVDEFSRQAALFAAAPEMNDAGAMRLLIDASGVSADDDVLDVACGPGIVACAFARVARSVTGIDLTPAMIDEARVLQKREGLENLSWRVGDIARLDCTDASYSIVVSRYAFHHLHDPSVVLHEVRRVLAPGGRLVIADATPPAGLATAYNEIERLRDPSHTRALSDEEFLRLFEATGLRGEVVSRYRLEYSLDELIESSSASDRDKDEIRRRLVSALDRDESGLAPARDGDGVRVSFPISILVARVE